MQLTEHQRERVASVIETLTFSDSIAEHDYIVDRRDSGEVDIQVKIVTPEHEEPRLLTRKLDISLIYPRGPTTKLCENHQGISYWYTIKQVEEL